MSREYQINFVEALEAPLLTTIAGMSTIVVVDDEVGVRDLLKDALNSDGHTAFAVSSGGDALELLRTLQPDLCIVDINMPGMDGFELLENIRGQHHNTPVLMLSARGADADVERGLRLGADDYVRKPFGLAELLLRVGAILRRYEPLPGSSGETLYCGPLSLDRERHIVALDGNEVEMSATEFRLLDHLMSKQERVCTREFLLEEVWGIDFESQTSVLDTYVSYVRRKVHREGFEPIKTVRGVGFKMVPPA